jgi:peptidoglycan hydrolase-like protein with peptidoglycan-binding domain
MRLGTRIAVAVAAAALLGYLVVASRSSPPAPDPAPAGFDAAFFPTIGKDDRGVDVLAAQLMLAHAGERAQDFGTFDAARFDAATFGAATFDAATFDAARSFQDDHDLVSDGIIGPATWTKLAPNLKPDDKNPAVRALQHQLNAKLDAKLPVDGVYAGDTVQAVRDFQQHADLPPDGVVGFNTWRNLLWHYGMPRFGDTLCDQDPDGNGKANWGAGSMIAALQAAAAQFTARAGGGGPVPVGDLSFEHGGVIPGHGSHQVGMDVDLWPIRSDGKQCTAGRITWRSATYDRAATRQLVLDLRQNAPGHVAHIWFNDPELIAEGLTEPLVEHDNHLHVRYCAAGHPRPAYRC